MSGSIDLKCSINLVSNCLSVAIGIISLFSDLNGCSWFCLSKIKITHLFGVLSQYAIEVIGIGAFSMYSSVKAPPISHSISKNSSLCPLDGVSLFLYLSIRNFW